MHAKLLLIRYALFEDVQICKVIVKVMFSLNKEQRGVTKKDTKGRNKPAVN